MSKSKTATKTRKPAAAKTAKEAADPALSPRVFHIDEQLRESVKQARINSGLKNSDWLSLAVASELSSICSLLEAMGMQADQGKTRPCRVMLSQNDLQDLREASDRFGIPAVSLLKLCMARSAADQPKTTKSRSRKGGAK